MSNVAIDARMINHSGIGTHLRGLLEGFALSKTPPTFTLLGDPPALAAWEMCARHELVSYTAKIYSLGEQLHFPFRQLRGKVLHSPHYNVPVLRQKRLAVTVHDLIHLLFPEVLNSSLKSAYARFLMNAVKRRATRIIAVSENTRRDLIERLGIKPERIRVIHNAISESFKAEDDEVRIRQLSAQLSLPAEYLLAVGIDKPHKNLARLIEVLAALWQSKRLALPLVIVGVDPARSALPKLAADLRAADKVHFVAPAGYGEMPVIYQRARALIFPSLYEGFGLPVLEAQAVGTPVAASNAASLPEVAGEGALFFSPTDQEGMGYQITKLVEDESVRARLRSTGLENIKRFSWRESARQTLEVYAECE